ncbi:MAG TPA: M67 family metallopeptidase [Pyrinomonadaceae bacterium]|nr:M67 family metallopeptidase [Pyrinomonadaceae bacterium]
MWPAKGSRIIITLRRTQIEEIFSHARTARPSECCGLIGGRGPMAETLYALRNVSRNPSVAYEAAPVELFAAQRRMRERGERILAIYHSHPNAVEPVPSETDVRLAFYPSAIYLIIGFTAEGDPVLRAFHISEREGRWEAAEYGVVG